MAFLKLFHLSDEELFKLGKANNQDATTILYNRYLTMRKGLARLNNPDAFSLLGDEYILDAFNEAFAKAFSLYTSGQNRFKTYFEAIYRNALFDQMRIKAKDEYQHPYSLDAKLGEEGDELTCLHDIVPSGEVFDDPHAFIDFAETLQRLDALPPYLPEDCLDVAKRVIVEGYTRQEVALERKISLSRVCYLLRQYHAWARKVLKSMQS